MQVAEPLMTDFSVSLKIVHLWCGKIPKHIERAKATEYTEFSDQGSF